MKPNTLIKIVSGGQTKTSWSKPFIIGLRVVGYDQTLDQFGQSVTVGYGSVIVELHGGFTVVDKCDVNTLLAVRWNVRPHRRTAYVVHNGRTSALRLHRVLLGAELLQVDHINGAGWDNRRSNLRLTDSIGNAHNHRPHAKKKYSHYKGVSYDPKKKLYNARIMVNRKNYNLGRCKSAEEAAKKYDIAARKYHGEFARTNFNET